MDRFSKDLIAASTIPIVLTILKKGDNYGYQIIKEVQKISDGTLDWKEGSLYPVLTKLEQKGIISSYIKTENGRNRKYYHLNQKGKTFLQKAQEEWNNINLIMESIWMEKKPG